MSQKVKWMLLVGGVLYFVWMVVAAMLPILPSPWPPFYWALPVHGQVIDADTGQPLEGVIVAAHWELRDTGWTGSPVGQVAVMEDVTDNKGAFTFRWWRPRLRWRFWGLLRSDAPGMLFFRSGYKWASCSNHRVNYIYFPFPSSDCDGAIIKLKKFQGSELEYVKNVEQLDRELEFAFDHHDCSWKKIPRMLVAMDAEGTRLAAVQGYRTIHSLETRADRANERWCGSIKKYLGSYAP